MADFTARVTISGDPAAGSFTMSMVQVGGGGTPPVDPPVEPPTGGGTPPDQDNWVQPAPPPQPAVQPGSGRTIRVTSTIAAAMNGARDGDTIVVPRNTAREPFAITKILAIRGEGVVWDFNGFPSGGLAYGGKAAIVPVVSCSISGFDISGVGLDDLDAELRAAVRVDGVGWFTIEDCHFHQCQNGIAAGTYNAMVEVKHTRLIGNGLNSPGHGGNGNTHNLYINDINQLTMTDCESTGPIDGHALKFRGYRLIINGGFYESLIGRSFDCPNGGKVTVTGATLNKPANASNGTLIGYRSEYDSSGISHENTLEGCTINAGRQGSNEIHTLGGVMTFAPDCKWTGNKVTVVGDGMVVGLPA
jgi:hypothetical protein